MASNENHFGLLSASQDPTQDVNKASNAARNRKKKERRNQKKTVEPISADETTADPDEQTQGHKGVKTSLSQVCKEFVRDASQMDCWQAWDRWIREVVAPVRRDQVVTSARSIGMCTLMFTAFHVERFRLRWVLKRVLAHAWARNPRLTHWMRATNAVTTPPVLKCFHAIGIMFFYYFLDLRCHK